MSELLSGINSPSDMKKLKQSELEQLCAEIRECMIRVVASNGGHLSSSLGVVELTVAFHYVYNCPIDKIIWDVGHQSYAHKLLTGRRDVFHTLRELGGISGFPKRNESECDVYGTGHSSTSISAALGLAAARDLSHERNHITAVIGDGALTGGMAYEALNHAGGLKKNLLVILNDNNMSIGHNVGSMSAYLGRLRSDPKYKRLKEELDGFIRKIPAIGDTMANSADRLRNALKYSIVPGILFEELGFTYLGPVDGHRLLSLIVMLKQARKIGGPVLLHVLTQKGKGYIHAERHPSHFHGVGPFDMNNGLPPLEVKEEKGTSYTEVFGKTLVDLGKKDERIVAITAAMAGGTGLDHFAREIPGRFFDVGIAEQHALTLAAGLAAGGYRPVAAIYSTFLQRAYDQVLHDLAIQKLPVILALDRAGIVGQDGETHQGVFDVSFLRNIPNLSIMAPMDENEMRNMLKTALEYDEGPVVIRYPRSAGEGVNLEEPRILPWGRGELLNEDGDILILALGSMVYPSLRVAAKLKEQDGIHAAVFNARFVKPLDSEAILDFARSYGRIITVEENVLAGGFGSAILEMLEQNHLHLPVRRLGIKDCFVKHGTREELLKLHGIDEDSIYHAVLSMCGSKTLQNSVGESQVKRWS